MNKLLISLFATYLSMCIYGQTNYIRTQVMLEASGSRSLETIQYIDGLGRLTQNIQKNASGDATKDIGTLVQYGLNGKIEKEWLPAAIAGNNGALITDLTKFISTEDAFSYTSYEYDQLGRIKRKWNPGLSRYVNNKTVQNDYVFNSQSTGILKCKKYAVSDSGDLLFDGWYSDAQLHVIQSVDEDGKILLEFIDKQGKKILMRCPFVFSNVDTYYVYDAANNLRYVVPPILADAETITTDLMEKYAYIYTYDNKNRCVSKQLPGGVLMTYIYDNANRLRLSQDSNQREKGQWSYYKYDALGRLIITGIWKSNDSYAYQLSCVNQNLILTEHFDSSQRDLYTCNSYPNDLTKMTTLIADYYDSYFYQEALPALFDNCKTYVSNVSDAEYANSRGLKTGSKVALLNNPSQYLWSSIRYDIKGLPVQTIEMNTLGGLNKEYVKYSFTGKPLERRLESTVEEVTSNSSITETYLYTYDHADRVVDTYYKIGNTKHLISKLSYDDFGRVSRKELYDYWDKIDAINYSYNIRGWLKSIDSNSFKETLYYEDAPRDIAKLYNGNISAIAVNYPSESSTISGYIYGYDQANRLTSGSYAEGAELTDNKMRYREILKYDQNSNITYHENWGYRNGSYIALQKVNATYDGNRLKSAGNSIVGATTYNNQFLPSAGESNVSGYKYVYDKNGNLTQDYNKGISLIEYNSLNLPQTIQMKNGNSIYYSYDALGRKHGKRIVTLKAAVNVPMGEVYTANADEIKVNRRMYYCGNHIYAGLAKLSLFKTFVPHGYLEGNGEWFYQIKDHLGNVRAEVDRGGVQYTTNYYPSGIQHGGHGLSADYAFGGKELQSSHSVNLYDFEARYYDPIFGFTTMDPLCEKYYGMSPYSYCAGNPVNLIDPDGREPRIYVETKGFGHAFVTVGTGDNTIVYTYGRYGELGKDKSSARNTTPIGEGVLIRLTGSEAKQFIKDQMLTNEAVAFEFKNGSDELVAKHFEDKLNSSDKIPKVGKYANNQNARVIDEYNIFSNNCVTTSVDGTQSGVKEILNMKNLVGPVALKEFLNMKSTIPNSSIVRITYEEIRKDLKLSNGTGSSW